MRIKEKLQNAEEGALGFIYTGGPPGIVNIRGGKSGKEAGEAESEKDRNSFISN